MKITVNSASLRAAIARASKVDESSATWGGHALLTARGGAVTMRAVGYTASADMPIDCTVEGDGAIGVPLRALQTIAQRHDTVTIEKSDDLHALITGGSGRARVAILDADAYPSARDLPPTDCDLGPIHDAIRAIGPMISRDDTRPAIAGMRAFFGAEGVTYAATDGHRLGVYGDPANVGAMGITIPRGLIPALAASEGAVSVGADSSVICVRVGDVTLAHGAPSDAFPDVSRLIPERDSFATCDPDALREAVKSALAMGSKKTNRVLFSGEGGDMIVRSQDAAAGAEYMEVVPYKGEDFDPVGMNGRYVLDAIDSTGCAQIAFADDLSPVLFVGGEARCIVMPMRA